MTGMQETRAKVNEEFGRLLSGAINSIATYEGKTAPIVEHELGQQIGLAAASIQRYKSGRLPPDPRTIAIFAEAAVKRGYLSRRWLVRFLHAGGYPSPDDLIDQLCAATVAEPPAGRVPSNLPAPSYGRFVMRQQPYTEIVQALRQRTAVVVLSSLGGMGKTSLAREVAARCLAADDAPDAAVQAPRFDGVVWVSDSERPGYTTLPAVLDEIAHTLGYDGYTGYGQEEKRREVEQLLRRQRILVVVDNFETVTDPALLKWLLKLPEPSKALITTREYRREFRQGAWPVDLRGMSQAEAAEFISHRLQVLHMDRLATDAAQFTPLLEATGGNPKAIEMALGCVKYERRLLHDVVGDLHAARGDLFEDLFHGAWALLDEAARRILLSMTLFVISVDPDALSATADVRGSTFARGLERLADLAFVDIQQADLDRPARYALHPLVRAFAAGELARDRSFEEAARARWLGWYVQLTSRVGYCRSDLGRLQWLDPERDMLHGVVDWAQRQGRHEDVLALATGCGLYCYVRGLVNRPPDINLAGAEAARRLNRPLDELRWLSYHVQRLARAGKVDEARRFLPRMEALATAQELPPDAAEPYHHSLATTHLAAGDIGAAEREWRALLDNPRISRSTRLVTVKWAADCLQQKGQPADARALLEETLAQVTAGDNQRAVISLDIALARIRLAQGDLEAVEHILNGLRDRVARDAVERHVPDVLMLEGQVQAQRGDANGARRAFIGARDRFERIGLLREIEAARRALDALDPPAG